MLLLREPSDAKIRHFLEGQRPMPFSYPEVGASRNGAPPGYGTNHLRGRLGTGPETFAWAVQAMRQWKMYETGWTRLCWPDAPILEGTVVGVVGRHLGLRSLNACRIAYVYEDEGPVAETLRVRCRHVAGSRGARRRALHGRVARGRRLGVLRSIRFLPPGPPLVKATRPLARLIQGRFAPDSLQSMATAIRLPTKS